MYIYIYNTNWAYKTINQGSKWTITAYEQFIVHKITSEIKN